MGSFIPSNEGITHKDHTADLWLEAKDVDVPSMISRLVQGIYGVMAVSFVTDDDVVDLELEFEGPDIETAMIEFLSEVLFLFDAESTVLLRSDLSVEYLPGSVKLKVTGKAAVAAIPEGMGGMEVKAVTYHGATIRMEEGAVVGTVLLDL